ncbi:PREDICTED: quinone oxidoreductase-like protein 2 [Nicrophorus vespilloides]|uniref:Quinone oxidoreductase-like protein 2 n=1 Tax=Nicrophorus vespilloides TaxID=110193 RepID=A0ABM1NC22_NICVS|nr:PREDICTED: quinone oxidoreductase-like protein 2 [Nicrophorus vespilloides]
MFAKNLLTSNVIQRQAKRLASKYRAAILKKHGDSLVIEEVKQKSLKNNQVRINVAYCSVNSIDVKTFRDTATPVPFVPGYELTGEVLEVGSDVSPDIISVGERVAALNLNKFGGLAQECIVDMEDVWRVPSNLPLMDAAVILLGHSTALYTFSKLFPLDAKQTVVISAATGGNGLAAVDVAARVYQAKVIAITDTEVNSEVTRSKGAFQTMHFHKNLRKDINKLLKNEGAPIIYDAVGDYMLEEIAKCVSTNGKIICASTRLGNTIATPPAHCTLSVVSLEALRAQDLDMYRQMVSDTLDMAADELISGHISESCSLTDVKNAITHIDSKKCSGKVVVKID